MVSPSFMLAACDLVPRIVRMAGWPTPLDEAKAAFRAAWDVHG
jgi:hypothetical protein